tara:strand:- start:198 stop:965 length:768 start_codon:yes stop_codon:yes gene_type:complete
MIFDTNVHLTLNDEYATKTKLYKNLNKNFIKIYKKYRLKGFACVGLPNKSSYDHLNFYRKFNKENIFPVAALNSKFNINQELKKISSIGFKAIKIHPRNLKCTFDELDLEKVMFYNRKYNLKILLCTYFNDVPNNLYDTDPKYYISKAIKKNHNQKIIFMHGGCERILEFAEIARFSNNILLDLSLTIMKYEKSSVDNDIRYLFNYFDQKITLGSDFPEWNYDKFIKRIKFFSKNLSLKKKQNIYYKNIIKFLSD